MRWNPDEIVDWIWTIWGGAYVGGLIAGMAYGLTILWAALFP